MLRRTKPTSVEAAVSAATYSATQATRLPLQRRPHAAFTLAELLVSVGVLVLVTLLATQLLNSAATIMTLGHRQVSGHEIENVLVPEPAGRLTMDFERAGGELQAMAAVFQGSHIRVQRLPLVGNDGHPAGRGELPMDAVACRHGRLPGHGSDLVGLA